MATKEQKIALVNKFERDAKALTQVAQKAYGSRATESYAHDVSRAFTELLVRYTNEGGSLIMLGERIGMTYPALRRRVMTADVAPLPRSTRSTAEASEYPPVAERLNMIKKVSTFAYHSAIKEAYDKGLSLNKLATYMGLKSAYPLYYGLNKVRMRDLPKQEA